jgi:hypothetical protein
VEARGGGFAIARLEASGPFAWAEHANLPMAVASGVWSPSLVVAVVSVIALVPIVYYARAVRQRLGPRR